jgi:hypothetical protein
MGGRVTMRPVSPTGLYWSTDGEVACVNHAPEADSPRWYIEAWVPIKVLSGNVHGTRYKYKCQHCAPDGLAVEREARLTEILERLRLHDDQAHAYLQRAEYYQRGTDRRTELAARKTAEGPPRLSKRR